MMESRYWRAELKRDLKELDELREFLRWSEKKQVLFERKIMMIAFQIRSLLDRPKVAKKISDSCIDLVFFPATESTPLDKAFGDIYAMYDWDDGNPMSMPVKQFCNQIIHYQFMFARSDKPKIFTEIVFVSDYKVPKCIFKVNLDDVILLFNRFSHDESGLDREGVHSRMTWDESKKKYIVEVCEPE